MGKVKEKVDAAKKLQKEYRDAGLTPPAVAMFFGASPKKTSETPEEDKVSDSKAGGPKSSKRLFGWMKLFGENDLGDDLTLETEDDSGEGTGILKESAYGKNAGGDSVAMLVATDGEAYSLLSGRDPSDAVQELLVATDGTLFNLNFGQDRDGTFNKFYITPDGSPVFGGVPAVVGSILVPSTEGILYDPTGTYAAADILEVEFMVVNVDGTNSVDVSIGRDVGAGGGLSDVEYWMYVETLPAKASLTNPMPVWIRGDDTIRGIATAANDAVFHYKVKRVN